MRGYPKHLNTRADYEYVQKHFPREQWLPDFQALLDGMSDWFFVRELESEDAGVTDDTHKVVVDEQGGKVYQYEWRVSDTCKLFQIGYTKVEVEAIVNEA